MLNLLDYIFEQGKVFLVITGNKTTEQDKNNKISPNNKYYQKSLT